MLRFNNVQAGSTFLYVPVLRAVDGTVDIHSLSLFSLHRFFLFGLVFGTVDRTAIVAVDYYATISFFLVFKRKFVEGNSKNVRQKRTLFVAIHTRGCISSMRTSKDRIGCVSCLASQNRAQNMRLFENPTEMQVFDRAGSGFYVKLKDIRKAQRRERERKRSELNI